MFASFLYQRSGHKLPKFQFLQQVVLRPKLDAWRSWRVKNTLEILPLCHLPDIRSFSAEIDNPAVFTWPAYRPNLSTLTSLDIHVVREGHFGNILAVTTNLRSFRWKWLYEPVSMSKFNSCIINLDQITTDLSHVQDTLENLEISAYAYIDHHLLPWLHVKGSMCAFRSFAKLKRLKVPQQFLIGFSKEDNLCNLKYTMPINIQHLTISDNLVLHEEYI